MKKFKKRLLCLLLCVCMCSTLVLYANAIEPLDGTINADDNATLITPTLEVSDVPTGAVAVGHYIGSNNDDHHYYRVNGNILTSDHSTSGYFPENIDMSDDLYMPNGVNPRMIANPLLLRNIHILV